VAAPRNTNTAVLPSPLPEPPDQPLRTEN
jgi:hypothetical protein